MSALMEVSKEKELQLFPLEERQQHVDQLVDNYKRAIMIAFVAREMMLTAMILDETLDKKDPKKLRSSQRGAIASKIQEHTETISNSFKALQQISTGDIVAKSAE